MHGTAVSFAILALVVVAAANMNPCHKNLYSLGNGVTCNTVRIPPGLCNKCTLNKRGILPDGNFARCDKMFKIRTDGCEKKLKQYVRANKHCDPLRTEQVAKYMYDDAAAEDLDYFVYAICEQCCDCIPMGSDQIGELSVHRGNCPAHAAYDICNIFPRVGRLLRSKYAPTSPDAPVEEVCPHLYDWLSSSAANNWLQNNNVNINSKIEDFLLKHNQVARCDARKVWKKCHFLERRQGRI